jgi:hypothetical protein
VLLSDHRSVSGWLCAGIGRIVVLLHWLLVLTSYFLFGIGGLLRCGCSLRRRVVCVVLLLYV